MQKTFAIGIPTINRWDLLKPSLEKYLINFPNTEIIILDNGKQDITIKQKNFHFVRTTNPLGVAASWNYLCKCIFNEPAFTWCLKPHDYAIILNDDIFIDFSQMSMHGFLMRNQGNAFYMSEHGFCSFILPKTTWQKIGEFDVNFKGAYFEDKDYERRLKLAGMEIFRHKFLNPVELIESSSIAKDPSLNNNFTANHEYYVKKWGGNVGGETFLTPFNK